MIGKLARGAALIAALTSLTSLTACGRSEPRMDSTAAAVPAPRDCGVTGAPVLDSTGVGAFRLGARAEDVVRLCEVVADSTRPREGIDEREISVSIRGATAYAGVTPQGTLYRVATRSPALRSRDSLGVGSTVGELRRRGGARLSREEGAHVFVADHCGFGFDIVPGDRPRFMATLEQVPDSIRVHEVYVYGCAAP